MKDPVTGRFFRFREAEHFLARQLDGATPIEDIRLMAEEQFGASLSQESIEQFIERLGRLGLLEPGECEVGHEPVRKGRVRGQLLYLIFLGVYGVRALGAPGIGRRALCLLVYIEIYNLANVSNIPITRFGFFMLAVMTTCLFLAQGSAEERRP